MEVRRGHFGLESGYHGESWMDLGPLFRRPARLQAFAARLAARLSAHGPDAVCGPLVGGGLIAQLVALELDCEFLFTARSPTTSGGALFAAVYALPTSLRAAARGRRVAVVDDVISAGSSVRATVTELTAQGATVAGIGALVQMGDGADDLRVESLSRLPYTLWNPALCPHCAAGIPLEDVR